MKKSFFVILAACALVSCEKAVTFDDLKQPVYDKTVDFTFNVSGEFGSAIFNVPMTRGSVYLNEGETGMTDLWAFDYIDDELTQMVHQKSEDADFGKPKMSLTYGNHHVYFIASRGADPSIDEEGHVISWGTVRDTFWKDYEVNVVSTSNGNRAVTLDRVATKLRIVVDDLVPAGCATVSVTPDRWYYGLDYMTGDAVSAQKKAVSVSVPESYVGTTGQLAVSIFGLSGPSEWTTNVAVKASDSAGSTLGSASITGAPFKRNRATEYHGFLFGSEGTLVVSINDDWEDSATGTW